MAQVQIDDIICYDIEGDEEAKRTIQLKDGGWLMTGDIETGKLGLQIVVTRLDADFEFLWSRSFGGESYEFAQDLLEWEDGSLWVAGYTTSFGAGRRDYYLLHLTSDGKLIKDVVLGTRGDDAATIIEKIEDAGNDPQNYFVHLDTSGTVKKEIIYGGRGAEALWDAYMLSDQSGWLMVGQTTTTANGEKDIYVVQTDRKGDVLWTRQYGGLGDDRAFAVSPMGDNWIIAGFSTSESIGIRNGYVLAIDKDGEQLWQTYIANSQTLELYGVQTSGQRIVVGGHVFNTQYGDDVFVAELDEKGNVLSTFDLEGSLSQKGRDLFAVDNKLYLFGNKFGLNDDDLGFFVFKWSALSSIETIDHSIEVFPNPVENILYIKDNEARVSWEVYNTQGKYLKAGTGYQVDVSMFPSGHYHLKVYQDDNIGSRYFQKL
jgi:hypothetical protein